MRLAAGFKISSKTCMDATFAMKSPTHRLILLLAMGFVLASCVNRADMRNRGYYSAAMVKDNKPSVWISDHPRVRGFRAHYMRTNTVHDALRRARKFLPEIAREFQERRLPLELAYLPLVESIFKNRANSGHAKGMWQFTSQTARQVGLRVGFMVDERLNWRKATAAAADYLDQLGSKFNYNWALALAAYNGGPNYMEQNMRSQRSWNFWELRLRQETADYVPRFIAMLQVAKEKYAHMMVAAN